MRSGVCGCPHVYLPLAHVWGATAARGLYFFGIAWRILGGSGELPFSSA